jgi:hypothetical protein
MSRLGLQIVDLRGYYESPMTKKYKGFPTRTVKFLEAKLLQLFPGVSCGLICRTSQPISDHLPSSPFQSGDYERAPTTRHVVPSFSDLSQE